MDIILERYERHSQTEDLVVANAESQVLHEYILSSDLLLSFVVLNYCCNCDCDYDVINKIVDKLKKKIQLLQLKIAQN